MSAILTFALPCWIINTALNLIPLSTWLRKCDRPLDQGWIARDTHRLLGTSTTIAGGLIAVTLGAGLGVVAHNTLRGLLLGLLVYGGHALNSWLKRRLHLQDGAYFPGDHISSILLACLVFVSLSIITPYQALIALLLTACIHPLGCYAAYRLKIRKRFL
ncbi:MAG TPA: CDP-archaeol synthase [bacterium]|nr:CDP-archaeol synthase [bacterium]